MKIIHDPSPNFGDRRNGKKADMLILHYTGVKTAEKALFNLKGGLPHHEVSAHYLVDMNGDIIKLVEEDKRAWHAGKSFWNGEEDINSRSIGIEIQNPGHENGYVPFPDVQMGAVKELCLDIFTRHVIPAYHVLAHSDIAPERKDDPGELFPWKWLAENGIGLWPDSQASKAEAERILGNQKEILTLFAQYGYSISGNIKKLITAFQRHFEPEIFKTPDNVGTVNLNTVSLLLALIRQKSALLSERL